MSPGSGATGRVRAALAEAEPRTFWLDSRARPEPSPALERSTEADLVVVGGGYTGLWTALLAKERNPHRDVLLLEAAEVGWAASGRNGGFCSASLTHGLGNGVERYPDELDVLTRLGMDNLDAIESTLVDHGIDAEWERSGELAVATEQWQLQELREVPELAARYGMKVELLDQSQVRAEVSSPTYIGGVWDRDGTAMVHPAKLAWGLAGACRALGVRIAEGTKVDSVSRSATGLTLRVSSGRRARADARAGSRGPAHTVHARQVALGTNAFPPLLHRLRHYIVPVYDYVLVTEPLTEPQLRSIGWRNRQGIGDSANQFHYYRLTADNRVLWGGYDAIYHFGNAIRPDLERRRRTFERLAAHFFTTFPQLGDVRFTHSWGGVIDTSTRFSAFWGTAHAGRLAYSVGYTGLGVGATRFGAQVMLDLLEGRETERTRLSMVRSTPLPFPPEPLRWTGIQLTRRSLDRADHNGGRRDLWLRTLDRLGLGFDS